MPEKITGKTEDRAKLNFEQLLAFVAEKFPSCVLEKQVAETNEDTGATEIRYKRAINWQALGTLVGEELSSGQCTVGRELFGFVWAGKNEAAREANRVIDLTLRPCPAESLDWDNTGNLYIEGDNLQALKMLQGSYLGKVKMIYIDPPYNTGNEFVYNDDFRQSQEDYARETGELDADSGNRLISKAFTLNADTSPRYHSKWCSMMYSRLLLARDLLRRDGVIFISIDDHEQHHLRYICDEVFGERNFLACFPRVTKKSGKSTDKVAKNHDYVLLYGKSEESQLLREVQDTSDFTLEDEYVAERGRYKLNQTLDYNSLSYNASLDYPLELNGKTFYPGGDVKLFEQRQAGVHAIKDWAWRWSKPKFEFGLNNGFVVVKNARIYTKTYEFATISQKPPYRVEISQRLRTPTSLDYTDNAYSNDNAKKGLKALFEGKSLFDYSKPLALVQSFVKMATTQTDNDVVLDFFSGSATTAEAVMRANAEDGGNRRFILVQLPEECKENTPASHAGYSNICEIGKERIRRVAKDIASQLNCTKIVHGGGTRVLDASENVLSLIPSDFDADLNQQNKPDSSASNPASNLDLGFRVFKVDSSNFLPNRLLADEYSQDSLIQAELNIKEESEPLDLLFECVLSWHLPLNCPFKVVTIAGHKAFNYNFGDLLACFEENVGEDFVFALSNLKEKPLRVVMADSCFATSASKINLSELFKMLLPEVELRVI